MSYESHHTRRGVRIELHPALLHVLHVTVKGATFKCSGGFFNYLVRTGGWKMPGCVTARSVTGCHSSILNKYSGHLLAWASAINIHNFRLVAMYEPNVQLAQQNWSM